MARLHQIPANADLLRHDFAPAAKAPGEEARFGDYEIIAAAKSLGFRAGRARLGTADASSAIMPVICSRSSGGYFILLGQADPRGRHGAGVPEAAEPLFLVSLADGGAGPKKLTAAGLEALWDGRAIVMTPRGGGISGKIREFNLGWFFRPLRKYWRLFIWVLVASFLMQLLGLATPFFFQLVMDKVLVHSALTTLTVLAAGYIIASVLETALAVTRNYLH
jgi:subfamily B ATP-binding cassette protein HlyB/CyaB